MTKQDLTLPGAPRLAATLYLPPAEGPVPGLVMAHGLLSRQEEFFEFPERLCEAGFAVLTFDFQGHGRSDGDRSYHTADQHLGDLRRALDYLRDRPEVDRDRLFVLGHSLGTAAVLRLLAESPAGVLGGILLAPPSQPRKDTWPGEVFLYRLGSQVAKPLFDLLGVHVHVPYRIGPKDVYLDPAAQRRGQELRLLQPTLTLNNYPYLIAEMDNEVAARAVTVPVLVLVAKEDRVVANTHSRAVFEALAAPDKEWVRISPSGHSMMGDSAKEALFHVVQDWLKRHEGASPPAR